MNQVRSLQGEDTHICKFLCNLALLLTIIYMWINYNEDQRPDALFLILIYNGAFIIKAGCDTSQTVSVILSLALVVLHIYLD